MDPQSNSHLATGVTRTFPNTFRIEGVTQLSSGLIRFPYQSVFQGLLRARKLDRGDPLGLTDAWSADGAGAGGNTTFSPSPGVTPEDAVLLLDEMPTQDNVLPPLCIFSAHSVEESQAI